VSRRVVAAGFRENIGRKEYKIKKTEYRRQNTEDELKNSE
jgi:hypothetical protein